MCVAWRILPTEHRYQIASSTVDISVPAAPTIGPGARDASRRRLDVCRSTTVASESPRLAFATNGWLQAVDAAPSRQRHR